MKCFDSLRTSGHHDAGNNWQSWPSIGLTILAILALIGVSGFFSGSETALTAASRARMHSLKPAAMPGQGTVNRLIERKDRLIGALLIGNNLVNILASALATSLLLSIFGDSGVALATLIMTLFWWCSRKSCPRAGRSRRLTGSRWSCLRWSRCSFSSWGHCRASSTGSCARSWRCSASPSRRNLDADGA
jgi:hypothetical protein